MTERRQVFYVDESMKTENGYVPALVTEDEAGFNLMLGKDEHARPWFWGQDLDTARRLCTEANAQRGISEVEAKKIVKSSIAAQLREDAIRDEAEQRWAQIKKGRLGRGW